MILARFQQQPGERKRYVIDYSQWLDAGETVSNVTFGVTPATTPVFEVDASLVLSGGLGVAFFVTGGVDREDYTLEATIQTSAGQIKKDDILFQVRE